MDNDQAVICRVCRSESTVNHPLFHPCKCSGSIRFVHQDCLLQWLSHSKKKYCELCVHPFVFVPIYCDDMPEKLPLWVFLKQSTSQLYKFFILLIRSIMVIVVWFGLLPIFTLWTWRFYFWSGENIGFVYSRNINSSSNNNSLKAATSQEQDPLNLLSFLGYSNWEEFFTDCFQGLIITAIVVIVFVAAYLFREWVIKNTQPSDNPIENDEQQQEEGEQPNGAIRRHSDDPNNTDQVSREDQISARLEELRQELERRRRLVNDNISSNSNSDEIEYSNPYSASSGAILSPGLEGYYNRVNIPYLNNSTDNDEDGYLRATNANMPSGAQSPFASWRDYQKYNLNNNTTGSPLRRNSMSPDLTENEARNTDDIYQEIEDSSSTGAWESKESSSVVATTRDGTDYFAERLLDETVSESEEQVAEDVRTFALLEHVEHAPTNIANTNNEDEVNVNGGNNNLEEPFDFIENIDGILEAIGMRGNLFTLLKNLILMSLMINLCLCITVWIPYVIGRSAILVNPINLIHKPTNVTYIAAGPLVNPVWDRVLKPIYDNHETILNYLLPESILTSVKSLNRDILSGSYYIVKSIHITLLDPTGAGKALPLLLSDTTNSVISASNRISWKTILNNVYSISVMVLKRWRQCASGQGSLDRIVCTGVGYIVLISIGSCYLSRTKRTRPGSTNEILRQQSVFLKVLFFIFLELVIFPTMCGVFLDISTLPLFTEWSIKSRFHFVLLNPYSGIFLHWFVGTGFIFQFFVFVSLVREVVRPGVLYFMRDPNDPQFHPVQEMVNQPTLVLLKKLFTSAATYFMLIIAGMGFVTLFVSKYSGIYPIVWKFNIPFSSLPIDILAVQFFLPPIIDYIVPREFSKKAVVTWWHIVSRHLRLSSFMFGGRYPNEEGAYVYNSWKAWSFRHCNSRQQADNRDEVTFKKNGGLVRVPAYDNYPTILQRRTIIPIDPITLQPLIDDQEETISGYTATGPRLSETGQERDTVIVYIPPFFKLRIAIFLFLIWTTGSILVCSISVVPLLLGRNLFAMADLGPDRPVHDLYSFALGAYIMIVLSSLLNTIVQKYHTHFEFSNCFMNWHLIKNYLTKKISKVVDVAYLFVIFGIAIPFFIGVAIDLYLLIPLKPSDAREDTMNIYLTVDWTLGVVGLSIFYAVIKALPHSALRSLVMQFNWSNIENLNTYQVNKNVVLPVILGLLVIIIIPGVLALATVFLLAIDDTSIRALIFRCAYPTLLWLLCCVLLCVIGIRFTKIWLRKIRDDVYLIGKRLHNYEEVS